MRRTKLITYLTALLIASAALAWSSVQTSNTLPSAGSTFIADLQRFLRYEEPQTREAYGLAAFVHTGGTAATSANLTHTISAVTAYPLQHFTTQAATAHTYTANTRTFVYIRDDTDRTVTIAAATVTYSTNLVFVEMAAASAQPATPIGCLALMQVDTSGVAITAVTDLRTTAGTYVVVRSGVVAGGVTVFRADSGATVYEVDGAGNVTLYATYLNAINTARILTHNSTFDLAGASIYGRLSGNSIFNGSIQSGVSSMFETITGQAYYANLTTSETISGNSLYGGRFSNKSAANEVTPTLVSPVKGMHVVFISRQNTYTSGGTMFVILSGSPTVEGLVSTFSSGASAVQLSGDAVMAAYLALECYDTGTWTVAGVSGQSYRNR